MSTMTSRRRAALPLAVLTLAAALAAAGSLPRPARAQTASRPGAPARSAAATSATPAKPGSGPQAKAADDSLVESVTVSVVNVDVYVSDKKGRITGLTRDDFELFEDGRPMKVSNFLAMEGGKPVGAAAEPEAPPVVDAQGKVVPKLPEAYQPAVIPDDQRLRLIVYIDNFNLKPFDRNKVMRSLRVFLDQKLRRGDEVMLVTYDRELHVRNTFTTDVSLINNQLLDIEKISAQGVHQEDDRREVLRQIHDDALSGSEAMMYARAYAGAAFNDLSFTIDALKNLTTSLAGLSGRKAIVYVSDGLPMVAGEDVFYAIQSQYSSTSIISENAEFDASRRFEELTATANADRVTFYTIDAAGLRTYTSTSAENATAGNGVYVDEINITNIQSPLQFLAEKTGGTSIINANDVGPSLDRIAQDFNTFYSLGYTPPHQGDGRFHKITVKVKRKGLTLRYREGYRDKSIETRMSDGTMATLQFPFQTNPLGVSLDFGRPSPRQDGLYLVPINIKIPLGKLALVPRGENGSEAKVRLFIGAMDENGSTSDVQQVPIPIKVPTAEVAKLGGKHFLYTVSLLMRGGGQKVAIGLRDDVGAQESYVAGELTVR